MLCERVDAALRHAPRSVQRETLEGASSRRRAHALIADLRAPREDEVGKERAVSTEGEQRWIAHAAHACEVERAQRVAVLRHRDDRRIRVLRCGKEP